MASFTKGRVFVQCSISKPNLCCSGLSAAPIKPRECDKQAQMGSPSGVCSLSLLSASSNWLEMSQRGVFLNAGTLSFNKYLSVNRVAMYSCFAACTLRFASTLCSNWLSNLLTGRALISICEASTSTICLSAELTAESIFKVLEK